MGYVKRRGYTYSSTRACGSDALSGGGVECYTFLNKSTKTWVYVPVTVNNSSEATSAFIASEVTFNELYEVFKSMEDEKRNQ